MKLNCFTLLVTRTQNIPKPVIAIWALTAWFEPSLYQVLLSLCTWPFKNREISRNTDRFHCNLPTRQEINMILSPLRLYASNTNRSDFIFYIYYIKIFPVETWYTLSNICQVKENDS